MDAASAISPARGDAIWLGSAGRLAVGARWIFLAAMVIVASSMNPYFRSVSNLEGFLQSSGILLLLAMGETFVLLVAGIDLSVGAVVAMGSVVLATMLTDGMPLWLAVLGALAAGLTTGLLNGLGAVVLRVPSFIVTFATMGLAYSIGLVISDGNRISLPTASMLPKLATATILGVPIQIWLAAVLLLVGSLFLRFVRSGRYLFAVGGNREASRLSGVPVNAVTVLAFALSGLFAGAAAVVYTARIVSGNPIGGANLNLDAIAAAVIGGVSLFGGRGSLLGACFGAILYGLIENILNLYGVNPNLTEVAGGIVVVIAGLINVASERGRRLG